ncbi:MAG: T9SS type A sorting domain-containing protein [Cytophagaceae bacterium]|jgi:hypothetical protein|nr:T9SS type A sorting domain-containing protein [Cytophagaceae bacterium]
MKKMFFILTGLLLCINSSLIYSNDISSVAIAGGDKFICTDIIRLSATPAGSGSYGLWSVIQGTGVFDDAMNPNTMVRNLGSGMNILRWTVYDGLDSSYDDVNIAVANSSAGDDQTVCTGVALFTATPAGLFTYGQWSIVSGGGTFDNITNHNTVVRNIALGENIFRWTVYHDSLHFCYDDVSITSIISSAGDDQIICMDETQLAATSACQGAYGRWQCISGIGNFDDAMNPNTMVRNLGSGMNIFTWNVYDNFNHLGDTVRIIFTDMDASVRIEDGRLIANADFAAYQWLDCDNDYTPIEGAVEQTFIPIKNGNYAVEITLNNCSKISDCFPFIVSDITYNNQDAFVTVYPNPVKDEFTIELNEPYPKVEIWIYNQTGKLICNEKQTYRQQIIIPAKEPSGIYFVTVLADGRKRGVFKIVRHR